MSGKKYYRCINLFGKTKDILQTKSSIGKPLFVDNPGSSGFQKFDWTQPSFEDYLARRGKADMYVMDRIL